jgi:predicted ATP-binding protein involved in virulence
MSEAELLRIRQIRVDGLFGLYNHCINLNLDERVTILHGPNGVGKTVILKMLDTLLEGRFYFLSRLPFERFSLAFTDGAEIQLASTDKLPIPVHERKLKLSMNSHDGQREDHQSDISIDQDISIQAEQLAHRLHWLVRLDENFWLDERTGEKITSEEVVVRYSDTIPSTKKKRIPGKEPIWFKDFRNKVNTHLIEAQRLLRINPIADPYRYRSNAPVVSTVLEYSRDLKLRIRELLARYGQQSQTLDQSFPQRLLTSTETPLDIEALKEVMTTLDGKRNEYKKIGLLDETLSHPFDLSRLNALDTTQRRVMTLYVQDTKAKLGVLEDLARRAHLLLDIVNRKFKHKQIRIDREKGLIVEGDNGRQLDIDFLSSGEQQEIVLSYDLLFRAQPNTLVLIDEPELSLHVAWQKRFLPDLLEIAKIARIDVLIATHSPFIVGDRSDLMVALEAESADVPQ